VSDYTGLTHRQARAKADSSYPCRTRDGHVGTRVKGVETLRVNRGS